MILDTIRAVTDWLGNGTYGVAAKLTALDRDGSDAAPSGTLTIADETRDASVAVGRYPTYPAIAVNAQPVDLMIGASATYTQDAEIPLLIRVAREDANPQNATRDLYYTLRAITQSIEALFNPQNTGADAARTRNQVQLVCIRAFGQARTKEQLEDAVVTAAIAVTIQVRDTQP